MDKINSYYCSLFCLRQNAYKKKKSIGGIVFFEKIIDFFKKHDASNRFFLLVHILP